jgi:hypothetical protein
MCAGAIRGAAVADATAEEPCVRRRFASESFRSFFPFFSSVIRAEAALANASTGICPLQLRMKHRFTSVVTVHMSAVA